MSKIIAVVRLAPGQVAFYDELTGTHLTMGNPMAEVAEHMNTTRIKRAVQNKVLSLVTGGFNIENATPEQKVVEIEPKVVAPIVAPKAEAVKEAVEQVIEPVVVEELVEIKTEAPAEVVEETPSEIVEEVVTEDAVEETETESKPKSKRKKKED